MSAPVNGHPDPVLAIERVGSDDSGLPAVLLPYQAEAIQLSHANPLFVCEKSRRTGITYGFAADAVTTAAGQRGKGGMNVFYIAFNMDMTREFISYCAMFAKAFTGIAAEPNSFTYDDGSEKGINAFRIDFPSGFSIIALSSKPRSLRSRQGVVIVDEAAFHDELGEMLKAAMALLMWGGRVIIISTHNGADNPFNELIEEMRAGKRPGAVQRIDIDRALEEGLYKRICLVSGQAWSQEAEDQWLSDLFARYGDAADEELRVIPARGSGTYLSRALITGTMTEAHEVIRLRLPDEFMTWDPKRASDHMEAWTETSLFPYLDALDPRYRSSFGQDFARSSDLSAIAVGQEDRLLNLQVPFILEMRAVPFREQEWILKRIIERLPNWQGGKMDARGNGQQLAEEMARTYGEAMVEGVMATQKTYLDGFPRLKDRIEQRTIALPRDDDVLADLRMVKLVRGVPMIPERRELKADGAKAMRHGDTAIALLFLVLAAEGEFMPIDFQTLGTQRVSAAMSDFSTTTRGFGTVTRRDSFGGF